MVTRVNPLPAVNLTFKLGSDGVFSHNECFREPPSGQPLEVILGATTLIVSNNRVVGGDVSLDIRATPEDHFTVLGNITSGNIVVNGTLPLPPPWTDFNHVGVL